MFKKALIASAMLVSIIGANAAETATFGVTGGSMPSSCSVALGNGGSYDFGTLTYPQLQALGAYTGNLGSFYHFGVKINSISVTCGAATSVKLSFTDNKLGKATVVGDPSDEKRFGLVDGAGTTSIGSVDISLFDILVDGAAPTGLLHAVNGTTAWSAVNGPWGNHYVTPGHTTGFIKTAAETVPSSFKTFTANMHTSLFAKKSYMDSAINAVVFNSSGVITLTYL